MHTSWKKDYNAIWETDAETHGKLERILEELEKCGDKEAGELLKKIRTAFFYNNKDLTRKQGIERLLETAVLDEIEQGADDFYNSMI